MKKTLIALAAVAVSSAAMAQVTISGVIDVQGVDNRKVTAIAANAADTAVTNSSTAAPGNNAWTTSRLDFSASEDLGNGLKATAFWSLNLAPVTTSDRDRFLSISGGFGTVKAGYYTPASDGSGAFLVGLTTSSFGDSDGIANAGTHTARRTAIQYTTPNMGGLTANVAWSNGKTADSATLDGKAGGGLTGLALSYAQGPLSLGAGMSNTTTDVEAAAAVAATGVCLNSVTMATSTVATACAAGSSRIGGADPVAAVAASVTKSKHQYLGASYNLGVAVVGASYKTNKTSAAGVNSADIRLTTFGVSVPMGAVTLGASMYTGKDAVSAASTTDGINHKGSQISARYALSKRTFAYVVQGRAETKRQATNTTTAVTKTTQTTAGLVHSF